MAKPVILFLEVLPDIKGGQQMLLEIVPAMTEYEVHAIVPDRGPLYDALVTLKVTCHVVRMHQYTLVRKGVADVIAFAQELRHLSSRVARIATESGARLLWANSTRAFVWGTLAARRARLPIVWHAQNLLVDRKSLALTRVMARMPAVQQIVGCSESATAQYGAPTKSSIVPLAVDLTRYMPSVEHRAATRASLGISADRFVVAHVGDLIPLKGQSLLAQSARTTPHVAYLIIGEAREDQAESVQYAGHLKSSVGKNVRFLGSRSDVPQLLSAADVLAITSTQEAGPRVLVEGMACGLPVVSTRVGMAPDVISPGVNGYLTDPDADRLATVLREMAADPRRTAEMGRRARELAERELGIEPYRQRMRAIVENSLEHGE
ncbi:MAG: glycosyltransferase family 4 protein [Anaerolineae bacterium]